jgi:ribose transport system permease protein
VLRGGHRGRRAGGRVSAPPAEASAPPARRRLRAADLAERAALPIAWIVTVVVFSILKPDTFPTKGNFFINIFGTQAVQVVLALALIIPLVAGEYDISVASNLVLAAMIVAILNVDHGVSIGLAILAALAAGAFIGLVNGSLIVLLGIDSFIVTLGTATFISGVVLWISDSRTIGGISPDLVDGVIITKFLGIPLGFWYGLALALALLYLLEFTPLGRRLLFCGRSRSVSRLSGLRVGRLRLGAMVASGVIAAGAGVVYAGTTGSADPSSGLNFLLPAFSAAFLGATAIQPGRFNPIGALIAVYFLATGITGLQQLGVDTYIQQLFYGGALVLAVAASQLVRRRREIEFSPT